MNPRVSIMIRCYNEEQHINRLLNGIMQQSLQNFEIIIVDSGSTDATLAIASRYPIKVVPISPEEFSFGRSLNLGCAEAQGEFIVIVSAHTYPIYQDWLEQLLAPFVDPQVALVYGKQRGNEITQYSEHQVFAKWFPEQSNWQQSHPFCNNANAAIQRSLWQKLPYDEQLTGLEDLDWAKRVMKLGFRIAYAAEAEIIHVHQETPQRIYNRYRREAIAFKRTFPQEHFSLWDLVRLVITNIVTDYYHAIHDKVWLQNLISIPVFRLMQFCGTYRGFQQSHVRLNKLRQTFYYPRELNRAIATQAQASSASTNLRKTIDYSDKLSQERSLDKVH